MEQKSSVHSLIQILMKYTVLMHENSLHATVQMVFLRFEVIFNPLTHMLHVKKNHFICYVSDETNPATIEVEQTLCGH